ncbi:hypothetical protein P7D66_08525 [Enterococcus avium]|uniref:hypothetical protein n=1 Tax=Enterococcus avium TaxID=33945 RepID=UPI00288D36B4|nr:hypothetical protein [Enterococcus avium]MDT2422422.1 hypothetical protein [Enterococcus avium]
MKMGKNVWKKLKNSIDKNFIKEIIVIVLGTFLGAALAFFFGLKTLQMQNENDLSVQKNTIELEQKLEYIKKVREDTVDLSEIALGYTMKYVELEKIIENEKSTVRSWQLEPKVTEGIFKIQRDSMKIQEYVNDANAIATIFDNKDIVVSVIKIRHDIEKCQDWLNPIKSGSWDKSNERIMEISDEINISILEIDNELSFLYQETLLNLTGSDK